MWGLEDRSIGATAYTLVSEPENNKAKYNQVGHIISLSGIGNHC